MFVDDGELEEFRVLFRKESPELMISYFWASSESQVRIMFKWTYGDAELLSISNIPKIAK